MIRSGSGSDVFLSELIHLLIEQVLLRFEGINLLLQSLFLRILFLPCSCVLTGLILQVYRGIQLKGVPTDSFYLKRTTIRHMLKSFRNGCFC